MDIPTPSSCGPAELLAPHHVAACALLQVRIEARIKVPRGLGIWPAFWLLPADGANMGCSGCGRHGVWAASGEIDVM